MHVNVNSTSSLFSLVNDAVRYALYSTAALVALVGLVFGYFFLSDPSTERRFASDSLLINYEHRIASVTHEMRRRSPGYVAARLELQTCLWPDDGRTFNELDPTCDSTLHLAKRDDALLRDWGLLVERFQVAGDWGGLSQSQADQERWHRLVAEVGLDQLRYHCQPVVEWRPQRDVQSYVNSGHRLLNETFTGVRCNNRFVPFE